MPSFFQINWFKQKSLLLCLATIGCSWRTKAATSKVYGATYMVLAFQAREFGFGLVLTDQDFQEVNASRENKVYADADAAKEVLKGSDKKQNLTESPLIRTLEVGGVDGYWNYSLVAFVDLISTTFVDISLFQKVS